MVEADKPTFLEELHNLSQVRSRPWILCGDFNMIYHAQDESNDHLDRRSMGQLRRFLNVTTSKEIHLQGRQFTWSNERMHPTLERIDKVFISTEWECLFPHHDLKSLPSLCSDHVLLLLQTEANLSPKRRFLFRTFWPKPSGFHEPQCNPQFPSSTLTGSFIIWHECCRVGATRWWGTLGYS
jgi:hypothetical protein